MKKITFLIFFILIFSNAAWACPMCSDIVERGKDALAAMRFGEGIAWSILLLLSVLFGLIGGFVLMIIKANRKKSLRERQDQHGARA